MAKFSVICTDFPWKFSDELSMSDIARGAEANYKTISISDLKALKIKELADPEGCLLALWVPSTLLSEGLELMKSYGFTYKQSYIWVKTKKDPLKDIKDCFKSSLISEFKKNPIKSIKDLKNNISITETLINFKSKLDKTLAFGMGHLFRQTHEICLIGINSNKIYKKLENRSQRSVCFAENLGHSIKPDFLHESLDLMFPTAKKAELFARRDRPNWVCVGNEVNTLFCPKGEDIRVSIQKMIDM